MLSLLSLSSLVLLTCLGLAGSAALPDTLDARSTLTITLYTDQECTQESESANLGALKTCHNPVKPFIFSYKVTNVPQSFIDMGYLIAFGSNTCNTNPTTPTYNALQPGVCELPYATPGENGSPYWAESFTLCDVSCIP